MPSATTYDDQRRAFGAALRDAMHDAGKNAVEVGRHFGKSDDAVRKWMRGDTTPDRPTDVFELEALLGCSAGDLSRHLGFRPIDTDTGVLDAIDADPVLDDWGRSTLTFTYHQVRQRVTRQSGDQL